MGTAYYDQCGKLKIYPQGGGGGVDLHYVETFDIVPPTPTFTSQPASAPRLPAGP